jgi:hypothetical protein
MTGRRFISSGILAMCLALAVPASAGTLQFTGFTPNGQGALNFTPGIGNTLTIGAVFQHTEAESICPCS